MFHAGVDCFTFCNKKKWNHDTDNKGIIITIAAIIIIVIIFHSSFHLKNKTIFAFKL